NPCVSAKSRIFAKFQAGHPKVENAIGKRCCFSWPKEDHAASIPNHWTNSRRVVFTITFPSLVCKDIEISWPNHRTSTGHCRGGKWPIWRGLWWESCWLGQG